MCLLVLVMAARALIPAGYMPDASSLRDGRLEITFCTARGGIQDTSIDLNGPDGPSGHQDSAGPECPFGILAQQAMDIPVVMAISTPAITAVSSAVITLNQALPPMPALGPPLGSRAPPSNLG